MFYEIDDFTDPWVKDKEQSGYNMASGAARNFVSLGAALARQYRCCGGICAGMGSPRTLAQRTAGRSMSWSPICAVHGRDGITTSPLPGESIGGILGISLRPGGRSASKASLFVIHRRRFVPPAQKQ
jgi:hypothetical protein